MSWNTILKQHGYDWSLRHVFYRLDWTTLSQEDIKLFLNKNVLIAQTIVNNNIYKIPEFTGTRDEIVMKIFKWVTKNIIYVSDIKKFGVKEKWEYVDNILNTKEADCESMTLLVYCLARAYDINPLQVKLVAGTVKEGGHCWLEYYPDYNYEHSENCWYIFDAAYDAKNIDEYKVRTPSHVDDRYITRWFEVNDLIFI